MTVLPIHAKTVANALMELPSSLVNVPQDGWAIPAPKVSTII